MGIKMLLKKFKNKAEERKEKLGDSMMDGELSVYASMIGLINQHEIRGLTEIIRILESQLIGLEQHYTNFKKMGLDDEDTRSALNGIRNAKLIIDSQK